MRQGVGGAVGRRGRKKCVLMTKITIPLPRGIILISSTLVNVFLLKYLFEK